MSNEPFLPHVATLGLATVIVATLLGGLLFMAWLQNRRQMALLYWAPAFLLIGAGIGLLALRGIVTDFMSIGVANAAILLAMGLNWAGAANFHGRRVRPECVLALPLAWIVATQVPIVAADLRLRIAIISVSLALLALLALREFWRGRGEPLVTRWPAMILLGIYASGMVVRIFLGYLAPLPDPAILFQSHWFSAVALATLVFVTVHPFLLLALTKERTELLYKRAALTDPLTDLLNRRAFFAAGEAGVLRARESGQPLAALICDLDSFKQINDRFGHAAGDAVLLKFSQALRAELRQDDILGRIGGEEFGAILPGCDDAGADEAAERVRRVFAATARHVLPDASEATVSIGIAMLENEESLALLLARADKAVYRAKHDGRNCIRRAAPAPARPPAPAEAPAVTPAERFRAA